MGPINPTDNEHFVPRVHLRQFTRQFREQQIADPGRPHFGNVNGHVRVHHRSGKPNEWRPISVVASESEFYDLDPSIDPALTHAKIIEERLGRIEAAFGQALKDVLAVALPAGWPKQPQRRAKEKVLYAKDRGRRASIAEFIAVQTVRTKYFRHFMTDQYRRTGRPETEAEELAKRTIAPWLLEPNEPLKFASALNRGIWILAINDSRLPLCTSDHPAVGYFHNESAALAGGVSAAPPSTVFLFPLSYRVMLLILERSWWKDRYVPMFSKFARDLDGFRVSASDSDVEWWNWLQANNCREALFAPIDCSIDRSFSSTRPPTYQDISLFPD